LNKGITENITLIKKLVILLMVIQSQLTEAPKLYYVRIKNVKRVNKTMEINARLVSKMNLSTWYMTKTIVFVTKTLSLLNLTLVLLVSQAAYHAMIKIAAMIVRKTELMMIKATVFAFLNILNFRQKVFVNNVTLLVNIAQEMLTINALTVLLNLIEN